MVLFWKRNKIHIVTWTVFCTYEILLAGVISSRFAHPLSYITFFSLNISLFYVTSLYVFPYTLKQKFGKIVILPLFSILFILYLGLLIALNYFLEYIQVSGGGPIELNFRFYVMAFGRYLSFCIYALGYYFLREYMRNKQILMEQLIEQEKTKTNLVLAENNFLKSQINPHLLFNTLNFVKFAAKKNTEDADDAIWRLSEIMRYILEQSAKEAIPVQRELDQIENLLKLNQLRFDNGLNLVFKNNIKNGYKCILPAIIFTLSENVFKHGNLISLDNVAIIEADSTENEIIFNTFNVKNSPSSVVSSNTGIENIINRLQGKFGDNFKFEITQDNDFFRTELRMPFMEESF